MYSVISPLKPRSGVFFLHILRLADIEWQWEQLRVMKVGGNESATKYFQSHGGSAALASKDTKVKYTSNAAVKYKDELKRRAAADAQQSVFTPETGYGPR